MKATLVSVIINNYNYARFLRSAIDSALSQTCQSVEVIVVDDGSTDDSRKVIASYGDRIKTILKENGGQASAINAGIQASSGDYLLLLDADDVLMPTAAATVAAALAEEGASLVSWPLLEIDRDGNTTGRIVSALRPSGDVRSQILEADDPTMVYMPTSCVGLSRARVSRILPIPEVDFRLCADAYIFSLALVCGTVKAIPEPQNYYRVHGDNQYQRDLEHRLPWDIQTFERVCDALLRELHPHGPSSRAEAWKQKNWGRQVSGMLQEFEPLLPREKPFVLIDDVQFGAQRIGGRRVLPFLEKNGSFWGPPGDDQSAIDELERMRQQGASAVVIVWPAFWWLDAYPGFYRHLQGRYPCRIQNERVILFDMMSEMSEPGDTAGNLPASPVNAADGVRTEA